MVNPEKCHFGQSYVEYLGHLIHSVGCRPLPEKVETVAMVPIQTTESKLLRFLWMINFCRRFLPGCATLAAPPSSLTAGKTRGTY